MEKLFSTWIFLFLLNHFSEAAVQCYSCSNSHVDQAWCGVNFQQNIGGQTSLCEGSCVKMQGERYDNGIRKVEVYRKCYEQMSDSCINMMYNNINVYACFCNRNYCNQGRGLKPAAAAIIGGLFAVLCLRSVL